MAPTTNAILEFAGLIHCVTQTRAMASYSTRIIRSINDSVETRGTTRQITAAQIDIAGAGTAPNVRTERHVIRSCRDVIM